MDGVASRGEKTRAGGGLTADRRAEQSREEQTKEKRRKQGRLGKISAA